jgi:hypothetical protein
MHALETLTRRWKEQNLDVLPGCSVLDIHTAFSQAGGKASTDVIALYSAIGGMLESEHDAEWRLWTPAEIASENREPSLFGVLFSDHLISSWCYRLKYETENRSSVFIDYLDPETPPVKLFDDLEELLDALVTDPDALWR